MRCFGFFSRISALSFLLLSGISQAQIFRCEAADGKVEYREAPCAPSQKARELPKLAPAAPRQPVAGAAAGTGSTDSTAPATASAEAPIQKAGGCAELERRLKANAEAIRTAIDSWHREMTGPGKNSARAISSQRTLSNLRIDRTMLAQNADPSCDFARRGIYPDIAAGKRIPEELESGLSEREIMQCDAMRTEIVALRAKTGRYPGAGRPDMWTGEVNSPLAKEFMLEDRMNNMRCPQFGPPMSMPR